MYNRRRLLHNRLKELFNENDGKVQNQYIVLGEGGSYFYQWIDGNNKGRRSKQLYIAKDHLSIMY